MFGSRLWSCYWIDRVGYCYFWRKDGYVWWCFGYVVIWIILKIEIVIWLYGGRVGVCFDGVGRDEWKIIVY